MCSVFADVLVRGEWSQIRPIGKIHKKTERSELLDLYNY